MLYNAFDYYACSDMLYGHVAGWIDEGARQDVHNISLPGFLNMCRDCKLESPECSMRTLENIFVQVDAQDEATKEEDAHK